MIDRQSVYYYVGLAVLCIVVVGTVGYFLKPLLVTDLPPITKLPASPKGGKTVQSDPGYILWDQYEKQQLNRHDDTTRNPFLWPDEMKPTIVDTTESLPKSVPHLGMIIIAQDSRLAFLDKKLVYEGDHHAGYRVEKIAPKAVTLSYVNGKLQLIAPGDHFGPAEVKRLERSRP
ncbi:MAG: hypothetical protein MUD09_10165 [Desulfobacterales bacterium]|jgi:hypothetical protein|nr:hypothetical protein [Desulfobacterales bacterium]